MSPNCHMFNLSFFTASCAAVNRVSRSVSCKLIWWCMMGRWCTSKLKNIYINKKINKWEGGAPVIAWERAHCLEHEPGPPTSACDKLRHCLRPTSPTFSLTLSGVVRRLTRFASRLAMRANPSRTSVSCTLSLEPSGYKLRASRPDAKSTPWFLTIKGRPYVRSEKRLAASAPKSWRGGGGGFDGDRIIVERMTTNEEAAQKVNLRAPRITKQ